MIDEWFRYNHKQSVFYSKDTLQFVLIDHFNLEKLSASGGPSVTMLYAGMDPD